MTVIGVDGVAVPPGAGEALAGATLVLGGRRHLANLAPAHARTVELGQLDHAMAELVKHQREGAATVVLASGDPGYFGVLRALRDRGVEPTVLPAVSSVQRVAAILGRPWDDVTVVSAHGRALRPALNVCRSRRAVAVLTAPGSGPSELGAGLARWERTLVVAEDIGGPDETLSTVAPGTAAAREWRDPNVVFCLADPEANPARGWYSGGEPVPPAGGWALAEADFAHRDGMVTKYEVRALALARLAPRPGSLVWDVGAGSGSVGVECARLGAATLAVERDPESCRRITANAAAFRVDVAVVEGSVPEALTGLPEPDSIFVGGGGPDVLAACARIGATRVVAALAGVDAVAASRDLLRDNGYRVEGVQLSSARLNDIPTGASRLAATNPVFILSGVSP
ncbi:MAG: precorrin-6y C5,15-methyltransferase (decarboxylating) subunit CbiE [Sciscionella sp.]